MQLNLFKFKLSLVLLFASSLGLVGQWDDVKFEEFDLPNKSISHWRTSVDVSDDGDVLLTYIDEDLSELRVDVLNKTNNQWENLESLSVSDTTRNIGTLISQGKLLIMRRHENLNQYFDIYAYDLDNEDFVNIVTNQLANFSSSRCELAFHGTKLYFLSRGPSNEVMVEWYDFITEQYSPTPEVVGTTIADPSIAVDQSENQLFVVTTELPNPAKVVVQYSDLTSGLNFQGYDNPNGYVINPVMGDTANGGSVNLVGKNNGAPDLFYNQYTPAGQYRISLDGTYTDTEITTSSYPILEAAGAGQSSFIFGGNSGSVYSASEIDAAGNVTLVAVNNNSETLNSGGYLDLAHNVVSNRLSGYYHNNGAPDPSVQQGGVMVSNLPPFIDSYDEGEACFGNVFSGDFPFIENFSFGDPDGDVVDFLSIQSLDPNVLSYVTMYPDGNGNWTISGEFDNLGQAEIEIEYTDGIDTVIDTIIFDASSKPQVEFDENEYFYCFNELPIDLEGKLVDDTYEGTFINMFFEMPVSEEGFLSESDFFSGFTPDPSMPVEIRFEHLRPNGCLYRATSFMFLYESPEIDLNITPSSCGNNDGEVSANIISPNGDYFTYWNNGVQDENSIADLSPGSYTINLEDEEGCKTSAQANVTASDVSVSGTVDSLSCYSGNDASIELSFSGFNGTPNILWSTGASSQTISDIGPGVYSVTVWEDTTCQITETFHIKNPDKFEVWFDANAPSSCSGNDGLIALANEINATGNVSYDFPTLGQTGLPQTDLPNGAYKVVATDDAGCEYEETIQLNNMDGPSANGIVSSANCNENDGSISLNVSPNSGETITGYEWSNNETTKNLTDIGAGTYTVEISQSDGCKSIYEFEVGLRRPAKQEICMVTVDSATTTNLIVWEKPETNTIDYYNIYRETSQSGTFELAGSVDYDDMSVFNDVVASPAEKSWRYRITAVNHCEVESSPSSIHKTIHLVTQEQGGGEFKVIWDNYEGIPFTEYDCMRFTDEFGWEVAAGNLLTTALPYYIDTPPATDGLDYIIEIDMPYTCTADFGKAQDYNSVRSNKRRSSFFAGEGTGDPNNDLPVFENQNFGASVFPNPSNGNFNIDLSLNDSFSNVEAEIVDVTGKVVYSSKLNEGLNKINLTSAGPGVYIIKMSDGEFVQNLRIVKE